LLRLYVEDRDERAFADLVHRHVGLVYAAALRRAGGRAHLAEEISQKVFSRLARHAARLRHHPALTGWLYRSTRNAAIDAIRAKLRRQKLAQALSAMPDTSPPPEPHVDWAHLRPVIDEAMDQLKERDRELMLLRFFNGLTFAEVGARLNLAENTARMRTARALEKLRAHLARRGVTSTSSALGLLLAQQTLAAAPAGFAATVATAALAGAPTGAAAGLVSFLFMSKLTAPALSAVLAAGVTALVWTSAIHGVSATELASLRQENVRLTHATAAGASAESLAAVADEYANQAAAIAAALKESQAKNAATAAAAASARGPASASVHPALSPRGYRDYGRATPRDAMLTSAWAADVCDPAAFAQLITFDGQGRDKALALLAAMPDSIRAQYRTPEEFYGLVLAAATMQGPPPNADIVEQFKIVELRPGRAASRPPGSERNYHEYQLTPDGWKWVIPEQAVEPMAVNLNSETLARLSAHTP
jgi:RNA polymerase sigma factor (sigma-70 family)